MFMEEFKIKKRYNGDVILARECEVGRSRYYMVITYGETNVFFKILHPVDRL